MLHFFLSIWICRLLTLSSAMDFCDCKHRAGNVSLPPLDNGGDEEFFLNIFLEFFQAPQCCTVKMYHA